MDCKSKNSKQITGWKFKPVASHETGTIPSSEFSNRLQLEFSNRLQIFKRVDNDERNNTKPTIQGLRIQKSKSSREWWGNLHHNWLDREKCIPNPSTLRCNRQDDRKTQKPRWDNWNLNAIHPYHKQGNQGWNKCRQSLHTKGLYWLWFPNHRNTTNKLHLIYITSHFFYLFFIYHLF